MLLSSLLIQVEELIKVNLFVKIKSTVVLNQLLFSVVVVNSVELEHHDVWRAADPCFYDFFHARLWSFPSLDFWPPAFFPCMVQISFLNSKLHWSHFVDILICNFVGATRVFLHRILDLWSQKVLPHRVLKFINAIVHQNIRFAWIYDWLLSHVLALECFSVQKRLSFFKVLFEIRLWIIGCWWIYLAVIRLYCIGILFIIKHILTNFVLPLKKLFLFLVNLLKNLVPIGWVYTRKASLGLLSRKVIAHELSNEWFVLTEAILHSV